MRRRVGRTGPVVMLVVCLALGYVVQAELGREPALPAVSVDPAPVEEIAPPPRRTAPRVKPIREYAETLERPLFHASRKPAPEESSPEPEAPPTESPTLELVGVVIVPEGRSALVRVPGSSDLVEVYVGERIGGWRLEAIETDRIVLKSGESTETYRIDAQP